MAKEKVIVMFIRKDHINISIIRRIGEARELIPKHGFKFCEEDITHDYMKQKELHQTHNAANEYPHFQYYQSKEKLYHIGNLEALKAFLLSPPPSLLALHDSENEVPEESLDTLLEGSSAVVEANAEKAKGESKEEEEEREPELGFISQGLQTVEGVVKYSTSWFTSWFYTPPTVTPLSSSSPSDDHFSADIAPVDDEVKKGGDATGDGGDDDEDDDRHLSSEAVGEVGIDEEKIKDFKVVQTNWYWRQQNRVLRFYLNNNTMYRYDPLDLSIRAIHPLSLLRDVTCYSSQSFFQLSFAKSESESSLVYEYYSSSSSDFPLILNLLTSHSSVSPNLNP